MGNVASISTVCEGRVRSFGRGLLGLPDRFVQCHAGAIAPMFALLLIPIAGSIAFAVELGSWTYMQRSMQNAADSAAIAAATTNSGLATTGSTSVNEARAAAKPFGFTNGVNGATVTAGKIPTCPAGTPGASPVCYEAIITGTFPLTFSRVIGFTGTGGSGSQQISARAVASSLGSGGGSIPTPACVWAFIDLQTNGTPNANLAGCSVMSSGTMGCTGQGVHADYAIANLTVSGSCANLTANNLPNTTMPSDPYSALAANIPSTTCGTNPPTTGNLAGTLLVYCGNVTLSGNLNLTSPNTVVVIKNGTLDLNNKILQTAAGASATIIFSGSLPPFGDQNMKGTIDIKAPDKLSGSVWKGVAIYRAPGNPTVDVTLAGSKATWNITGLVYFPNTNVTLSGAVNHSSTGATCMVLVGSTVRINGNGQILQTTAGCDAAGLTPPSVNVGAGARPGLVQ